MRTIMGKYTLLKSLVPHSSFNFGFNSLIGLNPLALIKCFTADQVLR